MKREQVEAGNYGTVIYDDGEKEHVVYYDDDTVECDGEDAPSLCESCSAENGGPCTCSCPNDGEPCTGETGCRFPVAIIYPPGVDNGYWIVPLEDLYTASRDAAVEVPHSWCMTDPKSGEGWVYAIQLIPDITPSRVKLGFSTNVPGRLKTYKTSNPKAKVIGLWRSEHCHENRILMQARHWGELQGEEVFDIHIGVPEMLERISKYFESVKEEPK